MGLVLLMLSGTFALGMRAGEGLPSPAGSPSCSGDAVSDVHPTDVCPCGRCGWAYLRTVICRTQASPPRWSGSFVEGRGSGLWLVMQNPENSRPAGVSFLPCVEWPPGVLRTASGGLSCLSQPSAQAPVGYVAARHHTDT